MPNFVEGDAVQVTAGVFEGCRGVFVGPIEGEAHRFAVEVDVYGRGTPVSLRDDEFGPERGDGNGGIREPSVPKPPTDPAAVDLTPHG
jgi:hypothetical protein